MIQYITVDNYVKAAECDFRSADCVLCENLNQVPDNVLIVQVRPLSIVYESGEWALFSTTLYITQALWVSDKNKQRARDAYRDFVCRQLNYSPVKSFSA